MDLKLGIGGIGIGGGTGGRGIGGARRALSVAGAGLALGALLGGGCGPGAGAAAAGLDEGFGRGGRVTTQLGGGDDAGQALAALPGGGAVLAGEARRDARSLRSFALAAYRADGQLDERFGQGGRVYSAFGEFPSGALAMLRQPDGKLVVAGYGRHPDVHHDGFALARYLPDGRLDGTFGFEGQLLTAIGAETGAGRGDVARAVALQRDGKILAAGETGGAFKDLALVRYNPDGSIDETFGEGGGVVTDLGGNDAAQAVAVQPDGKILVAGSGGAGNEDFVLVRYNPDGSIDESFGQGGAARTDMKGGADRAQGIALLPDGSIVLGGVAQLSGGCQAKQCERYGFALARYTAAGQLDGRFGDGGRSVPDFRSWAGAYGLGRLPDGRLVLGGHIGNQDFAVALFREDGRLDGRFGDGGLARTSFGAGAARAAAVAIGEGGAILLGGTAAADGAADSDFALARYRAP